MKFENTEVWGFKHAIRGLRNPMNSWDKSDSFVNGEINDGRTGFMFGEKDLKLAQNLIKAGSSDRKFLRQIFVSVDITAPMYWWSEFDTYKVGTVANSTSKIHKLSSTPITLERFETCDYNKDLPLFDLTKNDCEINQIQTFANDIIYVLENLRQKFVETKDKKYWKELIRWLPESWLQTRTVTMNYENIRNMYFQRKNHKLIEWSKYFIEWVESLPYATELIMYTGEDRQ